MARLLYAFAWLCLVAACVVGCSGANHPASASSGNAGKGSGGKGSSGKGSSGSSSSRGGAGGVSAGLGGAAGTAESGDGGKPVKPSKDAGTDGGVQTPADAGMPPPISAFRVTALFLRDPHFFLDGATTDITDQPFLGQSVNGNFIQGGLTMDYDGDGFLDLSFLLLLQPLDPTAVSAQLHVIDGNCRPATPTECTAKPNPGLNAMWTIENQTEGACLEPVPSTTSNYKPPVGVPSGPCFVTRDGTDLVVAPGGIAIALTHARLAATYEGEPPTKLVTGVLAGFLTKTKAMEATLPTYLGPPLAAMPLSDYLKESDADLAQSPTGEDGYWLYLNFTAEPITYTPP